MFDPKANEAARKEQTAIIEQYRTHPAVQAFTRLIELRYEDLKEKLVKASDESTRGQAVEAKWLLEGLSKIKP